jgi:site-specific DNA recombinase
MAERRKNLRCAIYTRKSSEEGLEQEFNSLDAQREACEAFILSQRHEGWKALPAAYDDGGFSGGTMDRPALQKLLADIASGQIDVVVVYKVDRLTRALGDFARIVEIFDKRGVSFVSVTQQFNTTSSMGRLTLNVLLSFAQFEREVTGERIRDKIAASKKRGMWMGGFVPTGYEAKDRSLVINEAEAETVRTIFRLYLDLKNVRSVQVEAARLGLVTKAYVSATGRKTGGRSFSRGHIYKVLSNPLYVGEIDHKGTRYPGLHPAIIDRAIWDAVQAQLQTNGHEHRTRVNAKDPSLLAGLLFDEHGRRLTATHAVKSGRRYRYYVVSDAPSAGGSEGLAQASPIRIGAAEIESVVVDQVATFLADPARLFEHLGDELAPDAVVGATDHGRQWRNTLMTGRVNDVQKALHDLVGRVVIGVASLRIEVRRHPLLARLIGDGGPCHPTSNQSIIALDVPCKIKRRGVETKILIEGPDGRGAPRAPDSALAKAVARGFTWFDDLATGRANSIAAIADGEGVTARYVARLMELAFLPPAKVEEILRGNQPVDLTAEHLTRGRLWDVPEQSRS